MFYVSLTQIARKCTPDAWSTENICAFNFARTEIVVNWDSIGVKLIKRHSQIENLSRFCLKSVKKQSNLVMSIVIL